jgi:hypothetical protein
LIEDYHFAGGGRYGAWVVLPIDINAFFYDHENRILIGGNNRRRYPLFSSG